MTQGVDQVTRRKGRESIILKQPKENTTYQKRMGRVDHGYKHRLMGVGFLMFKLLKVVPEIIVGTCRF